MSDTDSKSTLRQYERFYLFIAAISLLLIAWQYWGMERIYAIYPNAKATVSVSGDEISGGRSLSTLSEKDNKAQLHCQIKPSHTFAYCKLNISLGKNNRKGLDLEQYESLQLEIEHKSSIQDTLLIYLNNNQADPKNKYLRHHKSNMRTILPVSKSVYKLPLQGFSVPSWWILQNQATGAMAEPDLSNVTGLSITTGDSTIERDVDIYLLKAQLTGKWIPAQTLYFALLIIWITMIFIHACYRLYQLNAQLKLKREQALQLGEINKLLHIQKTEFETLAKTDPLTGIANRAGMRDILHNVQESHGSVCSLIMFDIDHFKQVNDCHGHEVGDQVLSALANLVAAHIRNTDHFARWGGEEFILLCPDTVLLNAKSLANNVRKLISETELTELRTITCSFGVAESTIDEKFNINSLFESADLAMYKAKKGGRNRVDIYAGL